MVAPTRASVTDGGGSARSPSAALPRLVRETRVRVIDPDGTRVRRADSRFALTVGASRCIIRRQFAYVCRATRP